MSEGRAVAAVILAAGASRRYGSPKQLVVVEGRTLLEHVIQRAAAAQLAPVVAVVPSWLPPPRRDDNLDLRWIRNAFPERGMSLSLRLGLGALDEDVAAAVILLGDQPGVPAGTLAAIVGARGDRPLVAAMAGDVMAPPVLIERAHFHLVDGLTGDIGMRELLRSNPDLVTVVPVALHPPDVDTPADVDRLAGDG
jgi:molybdenum cofactor cytidylyltransferase